MLIQEDSSLHIKNKIINNMNIVYSSSDAYASCTGVSLYSLYLNNQDIENLHVFILSTDISNSNQERLHATARSFGRSLEIINAKEDFIEEAERLHLPLLRGAYNTYSRVMLNKWFSHLDKVMVVDSDTMVCGSLEPAWDMDLGDNLLAAVPEVAMYNPYNHQEDPKLLASLDMYYNMGICIVNLKKWREKKIDDLIYEGVQKETDGFMIADQSIINKYVGNAIARLPLSYNYYTPVHRVSYQAVCKVFKTKRVFEKKEFDNAKDNPIIIHFFGQSYDRPWFRHNAAYLKKEYQHLRNITEWRNEPLEKWRKNNNWVLKVYDVICYCLLVIGLYSFCLKFRYVWGQRIKSFLGIHR